MSPQGLMSLLLRMQVVSGAVRQWRDFSGNVASCPSAFVLFCFEALAAPLCELNFSKHSFSPTTTCNSSGMLRSVDSGFSNRVTQTWPVLPGEMYYHFPPFYE